MVKHTRVTAASFAAVVLNALTGIAASPAGALPAQGGEVPFTEHVISTAAEMAESVFATDLDGDGDTDVLSASARDDKIAWYENDGEGYAMLARILPVLEELPDWTAESLEALLKTKIEEWGVGFGKLAQPIRVAVSGTTVSPQIIDTLILLGRESTTTRIKNCSTHE